jgi:hypothetical protein
MSTIRLLFSSTRPIDRPIEKVIDYAAEDDQRLRREIDEYEVTENVEACFRKFLEHFGAGVRTGDVTETGIWVSGFYGSGKSSFTKYLGFALDPSRKVTGKPFLELLSDRLNSVAIKAELRSLVAQHPTAVIMLDLGSQQLAATASASVTTVLYWKVLQWAGYSKEKKIAALEFKLDAMGRYDEFQEAYRSKFPGKGEWLEVHNDPLIGVTRADQLVPDFFPDDFPQPGLFRSLRFDEAEDVRDQTQRMIALARRKSGYENILFLLDEAGQYVAPRGELILNLDGLARNLKELGKGRVWIAATGQQTLAEIVEQSAYNSAELNKLRDRFPISIELDARDIREITYRRLLTKPPQAQKDLTERFKKHGQAAVNFTRLTGTSLFKSDPDLDTFVKFYPFLPHHFDLVMELIRKLAQSTGGIGLRSAIRVIQDLLVDASRSLPLGQKALADQPVDTLACADNFFDTLRADIGKVLPHVVIGLEKVEKIFQGDPHTVRVAKAIAVLQPLDNFPRHAENIAAMLYPSLGAPGQLEMVKASLQKLLEEKECSVVDDPQTGGFAFLSESIKQYRDKRNSYIPSTGEVNQLRSRLLAKIFDPLPATMLENVKKVGAGIRYGRVPVVGEGEDIQIRIEPASPSNFDARRNELLIDTNSKREYDNTITLLVSFPDVLDNQLVEARRSDYIVSTIPEREADQAVAQFLRSEKRRGDTCAEQAQQLIVQALRENGVFIFQGNPIPLAEAGHTLEASCRQIVGIAAKRVFPQFHLVPIHPHIDLAVKFLEIERLDRMPNEKDPLNFVRKSGGHSTVQVRHDTLAEALRAFNTMVETSGSGRIQGKAIQDHFAQPPYGWSKDATRYVFAALFRAGQIQLHTGEGTITTPGPQAIEAFKSTVAFNRAGLSIRDSRPPLDAMDRAARQLEDLFAIEVLPLEEHISRAVRTHIPTVLEDVGSLPDRMRLLHLPGVDRAQQLLQMCADLLKEDASGAAMVLGASDCSLASDIGWAKAVLKALAGDGEQLIRNAQGLAASVDDLEELFPGEAGELITDAERETIQTIYSSDTFFERIPDLRMALRTISDRVGQRYAEIKQQYEEKQLPEARNELENTARWLDLTPEDRQDIGGRLIVSGVPDTPRPQRELTDLRLLLTDLPP